MQAIQTALGDDIIIWNNKGEKVEKVNVIRWTSNPTIHQKQFKLHQKISGSNSPRRTIRYYVVHRIITSASIASIKQIQKSTKSCMIIHVISMNTQWNEGTPGHDQDWICHKFQTLVSTHQIKPR
jgi:hypothetical protein